MKYSEYIDDANWIGGYYELSIEFHPSGNNKRINEALVTLEKSQFFNGIWRERSAFQRDSTSLPIAIEANSVTSLYGILYISDETVLPCLITVTCVPEESDWLDISIPQAILERIFAIKYPLIKELNPWLSEIDNIFIQIAEMIFAQSPFDLAFIGEEVSGATNQESITNEFLEKHTTILTTQLQERLHIQDTGKRLSNNLVLFS